MVYGPIIHHIKELDGLNTSNERIRDIAFGKAKAGCPSRVYLCGWTSVTSVGTCSGNRETRSSWPAVLGFSWPVYQQGHCGGYPGGIPELRNGLPTGDALKEAIPPGGWYNWRCYQVQGGFGHDLSIIQGVYCRHGEQSWSRLSSKVKGRGDGIRNMGWFCVIGL